MTQRTSPDAPDSTAARVALWRALHVELDAAPPVLDDIVGLQLLAPPANWRERGDMHPEFTRPFRASIAARARFIEDLMLERFRAGAIHQYVILGAGLDTFAQRRSELAAGLQIYEIDRAEPQEWKRRRLDELGMSRPVNPHFVPVDFETESWQERLVQAGFDDSSPAVVVSTGVSMYLTREATFATFEQMARLAPGSVFAMTFLLPLDMADPDVRPGLEMAAKGAQASGTPFISYYRPQEIIDLAHKAGFDKVQHISADTLTERYFADRKDGLRPPRNAEELLLAWT